MSDTSIDSGVRLLANPRGHDGRAVSPEADALFPPGAQARAIHTISSWSGHAVTPLVSLPGLAEAVGVRNILFKDESRRFGLGSFKALGGAYAVYCALKGAVEEHLPGIAVDAIDLESGRHAGITSRLTVVCATDGNHGRSVAWGAQRFGCRCVIFVHRGVSQARRDAIARFGAEVRVVDGNYDDSVREAGRHAVDNGWTIVADTAYPGYEEMPRQVMQGYGVMVDEAIGALDGRVPTHTFVQAGVGGLAAVVCALLWQHYGAARPRFITVEPEGADCVLQSALKGAMTTVHGSLDTVMAGLACGEVSALAWPVLACGTDAFMRIPDVLATSTMRLLAEGTHGDAPLVSGESGVAGLAALCAAANDVSMRAALGLDADSVVLLFGTEGDTDPELYERIVGRSADAVRNASHHLTSRNGDT